MFIKLILIKRFFKAGFSLTTGFNPKIPLKALKPIMKTSHSSQPVRALSE